MWVGLCNVSYECSESLGENEVNRFNHALGRIFGLHKKNTHKNTSYFNHIRMRNVRLWMITFDIHPFSNPLLSADQTVGVMCVIFEKSIQYLKENSHT